MTSQKGNNYILIGMPGAGKSTIGVLLAKALGAEFIDTDLVIQQKTGKLLRDIISQEGNEAFKKSFNKRGCRQNPGGALRRRLKGV